MKRTRFPLKYPVNQEPLILPKNLMDLLLSDEDCTNLIALYIYIYYTCKWKRTVPIRMEDVAVKFNWSLKRVKRLTDHLKNLSLLGVNTDGIYLMKLIPDPSPHDYSVMDISKDISLHHNNYKDQVETEKSTSFFSLNPSPNNPVTDTMFEAFWNIYPKHPDKGKAKVAWGKLCKKNRTDRPTWRQVKSAILRQKKSDRWQNFAYIPHPTTWINQSRWLDDPKEMLNYSREEAPKCPFKFTFGKDFSRFAGCNDCADVYSKVWTKCQNANQSKSWK